MKGIIDGILRSGARRVIIPGVGAFVRKESGEVIFSDLLRYDDGVFAAYVAQKEGVTLAQAQEITRVYADHIHLELTRSGKAEFPDWGTVYRTGDGRYAFVPAQPVAPVAAEPCGHSSCEEESQAGEEMVAAAVGLMMAESVAPVEEPSAEPAREPEPEAAQPVVQPSVAPAAAPAPREEAPAAMPVEEAPAAPAEEPKVAAPVREEAPVSVPVEEKPVTSAEKHKVAAPAPREEAPAAMPEEEKSAAPAEEKKTAEPAHTDHATEPLAHRTGQRRLRSVLYEADETDGEQPSAAPAATAKPAAAKPAAPAAKQEPAAAEAPHEQAAREEETPYRPEIHIRRPNRPRKRMDGVLVIAVIALVITIGVLVYGYFAKRDIAIMQEQELVLEMTGDPDAAEGEALQSAE